MKDGWWQREVAEHLEQFVRDLFAGLRPELVIEAPPQHGKSIQIIDLISWIAGLDPDKKTIYSSFSARLGIRANLRLQRIYQSPMFKRIFPATEINSSGMRDAGYLKNRDILEYVGRDGYFRNTTVGGSITGEALDIGVIDDPIKGRKDSNSITVRNNAWDWLNDDFFTRFSELAGFLAVLTRWHVDDPIGRMKEKNPDLKILSYPAIAENGENGREIGEPLFPEHKSLDFLMLRKGRMEKHSWNSLYQQSPIIIGGDIIKGEWFGRYKELPKMKYRAIFGDTAQKAKESNDYQVAECWGMGDDGKIYLIDVMRKKFEAYLLEKKFPDFWKKHKADSSSPLRYFGIEDKSSGTELIQKMRNTIVPRIPVKAIPRSIDKFTRVQDVIGFIEAGHVMIPESAPWVHDFIEENEEFTADDAHDYDDQVDAMCDAISLMLNSPRPSLAEIL